MRSCFDMFASFFPMKGLTDGRSSQVSFQSRRTYTFAPFDPFPPGVLVGLGVGMPTGRRLIQPVRVVKTQSARVRHCDVVRLRQERVGAGVGGRVGGECRWLCRGRCRNDAWRHRR